MANGKVKRRRPTQSKVKLTPKQKGTDKQEVSDQPEISSSNPPSEPVTTMTAEDTHLLEIISALKKQTEMNASMEIDESSYQEDDTSVFWGRQFPVLLIPHACHYVPEPAKGRLSLFLTLSGIRGTNEQFIGLELRTKAYQPNPLVLFHGSCVIVRLRKVDNAEPYGKPKERFRSAFALSHSIQTKVLQFFSHPTLWASLPLLVEMLLLLWRRDQSRGSVCSQITLETGPLLLPALCMLLTRSKEAWAAGRLVSLLAVWGAILYLAVAADHAFVDMFLAPRTFHAGARSTPIDAPEIRMMEDGRVEIIEPPAHSDPAETHPEADPPVLHTALGAARPSVAILLLCAASPAFSEWCSRLGMHQVTFTLSCLLHACLVDRTTAGGLPLLGALAFTTLHGSAPSASIILVTIQVAWLIITRVSTIQDLTHLGAFIFVVLWGGVLALAAVVGRITNIPGVLSKALPMAGLRGLLPLTRVSPAWEGQPLVLGLSLLSAFLICPRMHLAMVPSLLAVAGSWVLGGGPLSEQLLWAAAPALLLLAATGMAGFCALPRHPLLKVMVALLCLSGLSTTMLLGAIDWKAKIDAN
eukprot:gnl/Dysnectes_brevis/759_a834_1820.p1 GENE.gnl/Dysnectes_brevis/759_a834_1820~~gnl/Dysnectes_brevis/759_a834_1820.p1  ORF type:complete len:584 (-),score=151.81 gnl/Dysnectes_brevis/759_a834_1820:173-1924(-)